MRLFLINDEQEECLCKRRLIKYTELNTPRENGGTGFRRKISAMFLSILFSSAAFTQDNRGMFNPALLPASPGHYLAEFTADTPANKQAWLEQQKGLQVSFGSSGRSYFRTEVPVKTPQMIWEASGWKGEKLNTQLLVWSADSLQQVRFTCTGLKTASGQVIGRDQVKMQLVRYVISNYPYGAKDAVCGASPYRNGYLMPDRLEYSDRFDLPAQTVRPIWLSLEIPTGAAPGLYTGDITATTGEDSIALQMKIQVQQLTVPAPKDWTYRLDLWQNPWVIAWKNHLQPWSPEHKALLKQHLQLYADAGGKYITTYAVHSPWADNSYMIEGGMIEWIKATNGRWSFDYTIFDTYVELAMQAGIDKAITIYSPIPWGNRFRYLDAATGNYIYESWMPGSQKFVIYWKAFLTDLKKHLQQKGWLSRTYLGINENEMQQTLKAIQMIRQHDANWRITYAGDWHQELDTLLNDYSFLYGKEPYAEQLKKRAARGASSTFYVCCNPAKPNNFVFSPPIEGRWISWYSFAAGYDGFLRWAYDAWPEDPMRDARFGSWPAGDCYMVYPGGGSSVRFETMREGIVDFEKLQILKKLAEQSKDKRVRDLWQALNRHLRVFTAERDFNEDKINGDVSKAHSLVHQLTDALQKQ